MTPKPGVNEITVHGLTPTADETSIKVDGKGSATITDMIVEYVDNKETYQDVYPSDSENEDEDESEEESGDEDSDMIKDLTNDDGTINEALKIANEEKATASAKLGILENYGKQVHNDRPQDLEGRLVVYRRERSKAFADFQKSENNINKLGDERKALLLKIAKAKKRALKEKSKANQAKAKRKERAKREKEKKSEAKCELKAQRLEFWPKKVYKVVIMLETASEMTPASSRRGSISSLTKAKTTESAASDACQVALSVSYITTSASWAPRYDVSLNSPTQTGTVIYRAEFYNTTSETWKDAKMILSTSQTAFQGLSESIPLMKPWHLRLAKGVSGMRNQTLLSDQEQSYTGQTTVQSKAFQHTREHMFGAPSTTSNNPRQDYQMQLMLLEQQNKKRLLTARQEQQQSSPEQQELQKQQLHHQRQHMRHGKAPGQPQNSGGLFGESSSNSNRLRTGPSSLFHDNTSNGFGSAPNTNTFGGAAQALPPPGVTMTMGAGAAPRSRSRYVADEAEVGIEEFGADVETITPDMHELALQESSWSESGLTASYDIPGLRTIDPSYTMRRHKIASIHLKETQLSYLLVPKLRAAAFLKAKLRNTSSIAFLRGPTGLTLDGTFLGNTILPRCSAGEIVSLSLGVDPSVTVNYGKPTVHRSQSGIINKEGSEIFTRTCTVTNTKSNRPIQGLLLEQKPMSEDDRLRVEILQPRGLKSKGDKVRSGVGVTAGGKDDLKWGSATAELKANGEICWDFKIEAGKAAKFVLEYEAKYPSGDVVVGAS